MRQQPARACIALLDLLVARSVSLFCPCYGYDFFVAVVVNFIACAADFFLSVDYRAEAERLLVTYAR